MVWINLSVLGAQGSEFFAPSHSRSRLFFSSKEDESVSFFVFFSFFVSSHHPLGYYQHTEGGSFVTFLSIYPMSGGGMRKVRSVGPVCYYSASYEAGSPVNTWVQVLGSYL